eukprot:5776906-Alexandrium_andersonii.AAC.1
MDANPHQVYPCCKGAWSIGARKSPQNIILELAGSQEGTFLHHVGRSIHQNVCLRRIPHYPRYEPELQVHNAVITMESTEPAGER